MRRRRRGWRMGVKSAGRSGCRGRALRVVPTEAHLPGGGLRARLCGADAAAAGTTTAATSGAAAARAEAAVGLFPLLRLPTLGPAAPAHSWPGSRDRGVHPASPHPGPGAAQHQSCGATGAAAPHSAWWGRAPGGRRSGRQGGSRGKKWLFARLYFLVTTGVAAVTKEKTRALRKPGPAFSGRLSRTPPFGCYPRALVPK